MPVSAIRLRLLELVTRAPGCLMLIPPAGSCVAEERITLDKNNGNENSKRR